jgi:hypothetical protein
MHGNHQIKETSSFKNYTNGIINTFASSILKFIKMIATLQYHRIDIYTSVAGYV